MSHPSHSSRPSRIENMFRSKEIQDLSENIQTPISIKFNTFLSNSKLPNNPNYDTTVDIDSIGTINAIEQHYTQYDKILVLNMANATRVGGGWLSGAESQEEYLFRRTDLHKTLTDNLYPMMKDQVIYSPRVHILLNDKYVLFKESLKVSFISVAAVKDPYITHDGNLTHYNWMEMYFKIKMIFHIAALNKHDCLILGALGCGAFHNPPHIIAEIFCDITTEYCGYFKKIIFAIKSVNNDTNCEIFQETFIETFNESISSDESLDSYDSYDSTSDLDWL